MLALLLCAVFVLALACWIGGYTDPGTWRLTHAGTLYLTNRQPPTAVGSESGSLLFRVRTGAIVHAAIHHHWQTDLDDVWHGDGQRRRNASRPRRRRAEIGVVRNQISLSGCADKSEEVQAEVFRPRPRHHNRIISTVADPFGVISISSDSGRDGAKAHSYAARPGAAGLLP